MRVALADDSALFRNGLSNLLEISNVIVTAKAGTGDQLIKLISGNLPDVVILDIRMPPTFKDEGIVAGKRLRQLYPNLPIIFLSAFIVPSFISAFSEELSSIGYLSKDRVDDIDSLIESLHRVIAGEIVLDPEIVQVAMRRRGRELDELSERELHILRLMAEGKSNAAISDELHMAAKTVESYIARVYQKLDIPGDRDSNRRVLTVLTWLRLTGDAQPG